LSRNCLLKQVIEGNIEGTGTRGRQRKQIFNDLKVKEKLLEFELDREFTYKVTLTRVSVTIVAVEKQ
jgi:hypothetical protein